MASDGWIDMNGSSVAPMTSQSQDQRLVSGMDTAMVGAMRRTIFIGICLSFWVMAISSALDGMILTRRLCAVSTVPVAAQYVRL
jgi:hypothetical protein